MELTSHVEDLLDPIHEMHDAWIDALWVDHEPTYRLAIRVARDVPFDQMCALVVGWPILVTLERAASHYTFADVQRGAQALSDKWTTEGYWTDSTFPFIELYADPVSNTVRVSGPDRPPDPYLAELSDFAGVPVSWVFMERSPAEIPGKPPECISPTVMCR